MPGSEPIAKETFKLELERLVRNFAANEEELTSPGYTETECRTQFLTPFFRALGWDVENRAGRPFREMEVLEERGPTEEGRPDYTFRTGGVAKFFVEAKAPHEHLENERHVLQVKRYAWSTSGVFAAILTDFQEFRFYDASQEPDPNHPHRGLLFDFTYKQYLGNVDKLWEFSRLRVAEGSIETLLPRDKLSLRFRKAPDEKFLEDMTRWRTELAKAVHKRNPQLDAAALTDVVQRLLDRLIFIRVAEDRRILEKNTLRERAEEWAAIGGRTPLLSMLNELFHRINADFNGEIFKPHPCEDLKLEGDPTLHRIISELYPPKSPYRFDAMTVDLFGAVYERYLGKTIFVKGKDVKVEDKPEVRKAGGVYYTPKYIVDYIVKNTVGKLVEGKSPQQIEGIKILDPACGSGSFLIGAFQCLIDLTLDWYEKHPKQTNVQPMFPDVVKNGAGEPRLSIWRKAKILSHNLFGVDLDPQAVEITMMNLYLKALEGERDLPHKQHLLPELAGNLRCGNSLIAPDIREQRFDSPSPSRARAEGQPDLSDEEFQRLRPFNWHKEFPDIMKPGGFDAVIGNPPYVTGELIADDQIPYLKRHYRAAFGKFDLYMLFLEKAVLLTKKSGSLALILPNKFMSTTSGRGLRAFLKDKQIKEILDFGDSRVFDGVTNYPCIVIIGPDSKLLTYRLCKSKPDVELKRIEVDRRTLADIPWNFSGPKESNLISRLKAGPCTPLKTLVKRFSTGIQTGADRILLPSEDLVRSLRLERALLRKCLRGRNVRRYAVDWDGRYVVWPYDPKSDSILSESKLRKTGKRLYKCLRSNKNKLAKRIWFGKDAEQLSGAWFGLMYKEPEDNFQQLHILTPCLSSESNFALNDVGYRFVTGTAGVMGLILKDTRRDNYLWILSILNSKISNFFVRRHSPRFSGGFYKFTAPYLGDLPIPSVPESHPARRKLIQLAAEKVESKKHAQTSSADLDKKIDQLVYELYGLTAAERRLVDEAMPLI